MQCKKQKQNPNKKTNKIEHKMKSSGTSTFAKRNKVKQRRNAREKFSGKIHFFEKQWQFSDVYFAQTVLIIDFMSCCHDNKL